MRVLIIIPAYNEAENIERVVKTVKKTYPEYDYLVVNDDLDTCVEDVNAVILAEGFKTSNNEEYITKTKSELFDIRKEIVS